MSLRQLELAFEEAARELAFQGALDDDGCATIRSSVPGMPAIHMAYEDAGDELVLLAEIGNVPDDDPSLYREFLEDAYLGVDTRCASYAVNPANGKLVLQSFVPVERLDGQRLVKMLGDFAETSFRACRRLVRRLEAEEPSPEVPGLPDDGVEGAMRV